MRRVPSDSRPELAIRAAKERNETTSILSFPGNLGAHSMLMIFKDYSYKKPGNLGLLGASGGAIIQDIKLRSSSAIALPIPSNLKDNDNLRIERFEQGYLGAEISANAQNIMNLNSGNNTTATDLISSIAGPLTDTVNADAIYNALKTMDSSKISRDIAFMLRSQLGGNIGRSIDVGMGSTVNPKAALAFEGVEMKSHSFSWNLAPRNSADSDRIRNIITRLKQKSLPSYTSFINTGDRAYLNYPSIVDIYLLGVDEEHFMKFKSSMIRSISVDYTSQGNLALVTGGKPALVNINLELMEMDIHTSKDYGGRDREMSEESAINNSALQAGLLPNN